jgi:hypothetical protein
MLASLICPLVAARFEDQVATASALRWASALCFGLCSAAIWLRTPLLRASRRLGWPDEKSALPALRRDTVTLSMVLAAIPLIAMGTYVAVAAASNSSLDTAIQQRWNMFALLFLVVGGIGLTMGAAGRYAVDGRSTESPRTATWLVQGGLLLVILGAAPVVVVSLYVVSVALLGNPIVGPEPGTFFWRIGLAASYAIPVVLIALTLVGHAIRQRSSAFAFAASLLLNTSVTAAWLLAPVAGGLVFDTVLWVKLAQLNMLTSAAFAICWLAATGRSLRRAGDRGCDPFLATQVALPLALGAIVFLPALMALWLDAVTTAAHEQLGQPMGWAAVVTTLLALVWTGWRATGRISTVTAAVATLALSMTFCYWLAPFDRGNWLTWHGMAIALVVSAWCAPLVQWLRTTTREQGHHSGDATWTSVLGMSVVVLWSIRGGWDDPHRPWWSLGALAAMVALSAALACWRGRRRYLVAASLIVNLAATIGWLNLASIPNRFEAVATELLAVQAIALTLLAPLWLLLDLRLLRRHEHSRSRVAVHWLAAMLGLLLVAGLAALGVWSDFNRSPIGGRPWVAWLALASTAVAIAACLWDERVKRTTLGFYILGLTSVAMTLDSFDLTPDWLLWTGTIVMAAYASATSYLWSRRQGLLIFCDALGIPRRGDEQFSASTWLVAANGILVAMVLSLVTWIDFHFAEQSLRLLGGKAALVQALAVGLLARGEKRSRLQWAALSIGVLGTILWGWAWLEPDFPVIGLHRLVVVALALAAMSALYGIGLVKLLRGENEWTRAAGQLVPPMVALTCFSILAVLAWEIVLQATVGTVPLAWPAIVAVAAALVTVAVAALMAAALPGRDPLNLSPRGRTAYVYAAEVVLVLLLVHLRIAMPWLFAGMLDRYWPFIVMLIAFIGVALGEWFRRRSQLVLSEPLENTAALLPMLPVLGFWIAPVAGHYSMLLVAVGAMYATLATLRKSFGFGLLSALALNGALWSLLHEASGLGLARHPQLWFIPPALCVLGAAYLNRDRLSDTQMTQLRYLCSTVIYVSSTADIFLVGLSEAPWLPLVLAGLSIAGIFVGILLRVRGFLVLGSSFLVLALATMIWHAAWNLEQTWVWSASGIVAGMLIIALFAMFEKKRQDVLRLVDQLKEWEA